MKVGDTVMALRCYCGGPCKTERFENMTVKAIRPHGDRRILVTGRLIGGDVWWQEEYLSLVGKVRPGPHGVGQLIMNNTMRRGRR